jgi:DNA-directed RNA polymerase specialized sigma24 family protein
VNSSPIPHHNPIGTMYFNSKGTPYRVSKPPASKTAGTFQHLLAPKRPVFVQPAVEPYNPPYYGKYRDRMEEWSYPRARNHATNPAKFFATQLNDAHSAFLANGMEPEVGHDIPEPITLEEYTEELIYFLTREGENSEQNVLAFLLTIQDKLEAGTFCPIGSSVKLSAKLLQAWRRYQRENNFAPQPVDDEAAVVDESETEDQPGPKLDIRVVKQQANKKAIRTRYQDILSGKPNAEHYFYSTVISMAKKKIGARIWDRPDQAKTVDDYAQDVAVSVMESLPDFRGDEKSIYAWVNRMCFRAGKKALKNSLIQSAKKVEMFVPAEKGSDIMTDNPDIYGFLPKGKKLAVDVFYAEDEAPAYPNIPNVVLKVPRRQRSRLKDILTGIDKEIYERAETQSYKDIARVLEISEASVKMRMKRSNDKIAKLLEPLS